MCVHVCAGRKGARQTASLKSPEIKFIHSGLAACNRGGGGALGAGAERARLPLQGGSRTRTPLARAPAPQSRPRRGPAQLTPRRGGRCFPPAPRTAGVGVGIGSEPAGLREGGAERAGPWRRRREQEAAAAAARPGPAAPSRATCTGHPQGGLQTAAKCGAWPLRSCPGAQAHTGETLADPAPPSASARPNYLSPSSLRSPPPPQPPPPPIDWRAWWAAPAPGARVGAPVWAPGRPGCKGIFHSFLYRSQTSSIFLPLGGSRGLKSPQRAPKYLFQGGFRGVCMCVWWCGEGAGLAQKAERFILGKKKTTLMVLLHWYETFNK